MSKNPNIASKLYPAIGRSLSEWANLEYGLFEMFRWTCNVEWMGPQYHVSKAVFYSSRSFLGRSDMLLAAITARPDCDYCNGRKPLMREIVKKAISYNSVRNAIAHYGAVYSIEKSGVVWASPNNETSHFTVAEIKTAGDNFLKLYKLSLPVGLRDNLSEKRCKELREKVLRLPKAANSSEETPTPVVRKPRRQPSPE
jgi:hypothetical protein